MNGGVDGEAEYGYEGAEDVCWTAASQQHMITARSLGVSKWAATTVVISDVALHPRTLRSRCMVQNTSRIQDKQRLTSISCMVDFPGRKEARGHHQRSGAGK